MKVLEKILLYFIILIFISPILYMILISFREQNSLISQNVNYFDSLTLSNYQESIKRMDFSNRIWISLKLTFFSTFFTALIGLPAARNLSFKEEKKANFITFSFLATKAIPAVAVSIPIFFIVHSLNKVVSNLIALSILHIIFNIPILIWLSEPIFREIKQELRDFAKLQGASPLQVLIGVDIITTLSQIVFVLAIIALLSWNEQFFSSIFRVDTVIEKLPAFVSHHGIEWGVVSATGTIIAFPGIILILFLTLFYKGKQNVD